MFKRAIILAAVAGMVFVMAPASQGSILITNPGFEDPALDPDGEIYGPPGDLPGWTLLDGGSPHGSFYAGIWRPTAVDFDPVLTPEGLNVLYIQVPVDGISRGVSQVLSATFQAGVEYTLTVEVEGRGQALATVAAYIDLNPVRVGMVEDPKDYHWSGCGYTKSLMNRFTRHNLYSKIGTGLSV